MMHKPTLKTPVDNRTLRAIGKVVVCFAQFEEMVIYAIGGFVDDATVATVMQAQFGLKQNLEFLETVYYEKVKDETKRKKFEELLKKIRECEGQRNRIIHSHWWQDSTMKIATSYKSKARGKKGIVNDQYPITAEDMLKLANSLPTLGFELMHLVARSKEKIEK